MACRHLLGHRRHALPPPAAAAPLVSSLRGTKDQSVRAVGQRQRGDHVPRFGVLEHVAQRHGWRGPHRGSPANVGQVRCEDSVAHTETRGDGLDRPGVQPGDDRVVDVPLRHARVLERRCERLEGQRHVELLAEALLPDVRVELARHAPAVEELVAGRAAADELGHRAARARTRTPRRRRRCHAPRPSRPGRCAGPRRRPGSCGPAAAALRSAGSRVAEPPSATSRPSRRRRTPVRGRARRAPSWRSSCRGTPGPASRGGGPAPPRRPGPTASARRARLDAQRGRVLVVGGHRRGCPGPLHCPARRRWPSAGDANRAGRSPQAAMPPLMRLIIPEIAGAAHIPTTSGHGRARRAGRRGGLTSSPTTRTSRRSAC